MSDLVVVETCPDALVFDTASKLTREMALALWAIGFRGAIRPIGLTVPGPKDIDADELAMLLGIGYGVMIYQHVPYDPWTPTIALGLSHGKAAAKIAAGIGYLPGATIWDDLEGIQGTAEETADYANTKFDVLRDAAYPQGEYIGAKVPLTSAELYTRLKSPHYWRSLSSVPDVLKRGYTMHQYATIEAAGTEVDLNFLRADRAGARPTWMRRPAAPAP